jgi:hypothetical protein
MDFVKKHYEKIILSAVLLGLVGALVVLPVMISGDQQKLKEMGEAVITPRVTALPPLDLSKQTKATQQVESPVAFDFSTSNKLFNPVEWKKAADGHLIKVENGSEIGPRAVQVVKIMPLYYVLSLDSVQTNEFGARYAIGVEREGAANLTMRRKQTRYASAGEKTDLFTLQEVKGDPANPTGVVLSLLDTGETVTIAKGKPFQRIEAYAADLKYPPEDKNFPGQRVGSKMSFAGDDYIVVAVDAHQVILSAQSNQKKTTLRYAP